MNAADPSQQYVTQAQFGMFVEHMNDQFDRVIEVVEGRTGKIPKMAKQLEVLEEDMREVKSDIKVIKAVLKDTNKQLGNHERRITRLETKTARL